MEQPRPKKVSSYKPPSDAEQRKLDREIQAKLDQKRGYTKDMGRSLPKEEAEALYNSGQITPIDRIRHKDYSAGWY